MKIIFCINELIVSGGLERVLSQRVNYLVERYNYNIFIITTEYNCKKFKNLSSFYELNPKIKKIDLDIKYNDFIEENEKEKFFKRKNKLRILQKNIYLN